MFVKLRYDDVKMGIMASQITSLMIVYSTVYSDKDQRKHQSYASQAYVWGIDWGAMNSLHKWPVKWKMFPFTDVIMITQMPGAKHVVRVKSIISNISMPAMRCWIHLIQNTYENQIHHFNTLNKMAFWRSFQMNLLEWKEFQKQFHQICSLRPNWQ